MVFILLYEGCIARSSNGRTTVSGTVYLGSNPSLAAIESDIIKRWELSEPRKQRKNIQNIEKTDIWTVSATYAKRPRL